MIIPKCVSSLKIPHLEMHLCFQISTNFSIPSSDFLLLHWQCYDNIGSISHTIPYNSIRHFIYKDVASIFVLKSIDKYMYFKGKPPHIVWLILSASHWLPHCYMIIQQRFDINLDNYCFPSGLWLFSWHKTDTMHIWPWLHHGCLIWETVS